VCSQQTAAASAARAASAASSSKQQQTAAAASVLSKCSVSVRLGSTQRFPGCDLVQQLGLSTQPEAYMKYVEIFC
jgi:hypothetical protein